MGTTASGLRYPEPTEPVSQGAARIKDLAADVEARYPGLLVTGSVPGTTLPAGGGTLGAASGLNLAAAAWARLVYIKFKYTLTATALTSYVVFDLKSGATTLNSARCNATLTTGILDHWVELPANTAGSWAVNMTSSGPCGIYADNTNLCQFKAMVYGPNRGTIS